MRVRIGIPINGDGDGKKSGDWDQGRSKRRVKLRAIPGCDADMRV
jgi:hypothetical protein